MTTICLYAGATYWTVPTDFQATGATIECVGCGGKGADGVAGNRGGGGGQGGGYAKVTSPAHIRPNDILVLSVGHLGTVSSLKDNTGTIICQADYGRPATTNTGGSGAQNNIGDVTFAGGNGGDGGATSVSSGGGGGGAAGPSGAGKAGAAPVAGGGGAGGGGANGGSSTAGLANIGTTGGAGGQGRDGTGSGTGGASGNSGGVGTVGGGGGGAGQNAGATNFGGAGGGDNFSPNHGAGGGGGGGGSGTASNASGGGSGGHYGGGGGGGGNSAGNAGSGGNGYDGVVIINYTPVPPPRWKKVDRARETTPTTGTGILTLGPPATAYRTFAAAGVADGDNVEYLLEDSTAWEIGIGTYGSAGPTLTRTLRSSSTGSLLNLSGKAFVTVIPTSSTFLPMIGGTLHDTLQVTAAPGGWSSESYAKNLLLGGCAERSALAWLPSDTSTNIFAIASYNGGLVMCLMPPLNDSTSPSINLWEIYTNPNAMEMLMDLSFEGGSLFLDHDPVSGLEAVTKQYLDNGFLRLTGGSLTGPLSLAADPATPLGAATQQYVDTQVSNAIGASGASAFLVYYNARTNNILETDPGSGNMEWNTTTQWDATQLYVSKISNIGNDLTTIWQNSIGARIAVQKKSDSTVIARYTLNSIGDHNGWLTLNVTPISSSGLPFAPNTALLVAIVTSAALLPLSGGTMTGNLFLAADPTTPLMAATKQYVDTTGVTLFNTRTGSVVLNSTDVTTALGFTPYNSTNPSGYQTSSQVVTALAAGNPGAFTTLSASGTVSGAGFTALLSPYALTSSVPVASSTTPVMDSAAAIGVGTTWARADHVHPVDTSRYAASNPSGYQTSAQVVTALAAGNPGAFSTLSASSTVSGAGFATLLSPYALLASPTFSGTPTLPTGTIGVTQIAGTNNTSLATTAFVTAAITAANAGVSSFNTRTGTVVLNSTDVTTALGFTPYNSTNPSGFQTSAQVITALAAGSPGAFSTLSASGTVSGAGFTSLLSPYALTSSVPVASSTTPIMDGTATIGVGTTWARSDHVHPVDTSRYAASNPSGYQTAAQVTTALAAGSPGAFSTLSASGAVSGVGFTTYFASPPAIGATAANTGAFTTLSASGTVSGAGFTSLLSPYALTSSVPVASSTTPIMDSTATIGVGTTWARADHIHPTDTSRYAASNPSGYQTAAQVLAIRLDQFAAPTVDVGWNSHKITGLLDPGNPQDAATKNYVDTVAQGLDAKASVRAATTANLASLSAPQTVDGVSLIAGDRVLVKDQTTQSANGIYVVQAGAWTRATDADTWAELPSAYVFVELGTVNADNGFLCTVDQGGTLGTTAVTWVQFSGAGQVLAGGGLTKTGNQLDVVGTAARIAIFADNIDIDSSYVGQASITTLGTIATGTWNATTIGVAKGGTGVATLTGYVKGSGTSPFTASATIPNTDITGLGTMATQNATAVAITGGTINSASVGATTPSTGAFTTLSASGAVSGAGFTTLLSPYALLASPAFSGTPSLPTGTIGVTQVAGTNNTSLATTAFVTAAVAAATAGVSSFNTRTGPVVLNSTDVTTALGFTPYNATNPSGYIPDAPSDGSAYLRANNSWSSGGKVAHNLAVGSAVIPASASDGNIFIGRSMVGISETSSITFGAYFDTLSNWKYLGNTAAMAYSVFNGKFSFYTAPIGTQDSTVPFALCYTVEPGLFTLNSGTSLVVGGTIGPLRFGTVLAASPTDLSKHIELYTGFGGFSITSGRLNIVASQQTWFVNASADVASFDSNGLTMMGGKNVILSADPSTAMQAATKQYVDNRDALNLPLAGGTMTGVLRMPNGTASVPSINFGTANTGIYGASSGISMTLSIQGVGYFLFQTSSFYSQLPIRGPDGTAAICALSFGGEAGSGLWRKGTGSVSLSGNASEVMNWSGGTKTTTAYGPVVLAADPTAALQAATKQYVDGRTPIVSDAPVDPFAYGRKSSAWTAVPDIRSVGGGAMDLNAITQPTIALFTITNQTSAPNWPADCYDQCALLLHGYNSNAAWQSQLLMSGRQRGTMPALWYRSYDDGYPGNNNWSPWNRIMAATGGAFTGAVTFAADPTTALGAATKQYVDKMLPLSGGTMTGALLSNSYISLNSGVASGPQDLSRGIVLWGTTTGYGFAVTSSTLNYNTVGGTSKHDFYSDSRLLLRIQDGTSITSYLPLQVNSTTNLANDLTVDGNIFVTNTHGGWPGVKWNGVGVGSAAGYFESQRNGKSRWSVEFGGTEAETGGNAGTNFLINRFDDTGAVLSPNPLAINRATGMVTMNAGLTLGATLRTTNTYGYYWTDVSGTTPGMFLQSDNNWIWNGTNAAGANRVIAAIYMRNDTSRLVFYPDVQIQGFIWLSADPTQPLHAATKQYVDSKSSTVTISDTAPGSPSTGSLWFDSVNAQLYIRYADANSSQWVVANYTAGLTDAASDGKAYSRRNAAWTSVPFYDANTNVGINLTPPSPAFAGSIFASRFISSVDGFYNNSYTTNGTDWLRLATGGATWIGSATSGTVVIQTAPSGAAGSAITPVGNFYFDNRGNFGIGVAPPAGQSLPILANGGGWSFQWGTTLNNWANNAYYDGTNWRYMATGYAWNQQMTGSQMMWQAAVSGTAGAIPAMTTLMTLDTVGNLVTTGSVTATSQLRVNSASYPRCTLYVSGAPANQKYVDAFADPSGNFIIQFVNDAFNAGSGFFSANRSGYAVTGVTLTAPTITMSGNVLCSGTVTAGPTSGSNVVLQPSGGNAGYVAFYSGATRMGYIGNSDGTHLYLSCDSQADMMVLAPVTNFQGAVLAATGRVISRNSANNPGFCCYNSAAGAMGMIADGGANLLFGTMNYDGTWVQTFMYLNRGNGYLYGSFGAIFSGYVQGANGIFASTDNQFGMTAGGSGRIISIASNWYIDWTSANGVLTWMAGGNPFWVWRCTDWWTYNNYGPVAGVGNYVVLSDVRGKEQIATASHGLAHIMRLRPVSFRRVHKLKSSRQPKTELGFVAQEVLDVLPEAVHETGMSLPDGSGGMDTDSPSLGITHDSILAVAVNAIQELAAITKDLKDRITILEGALAA